MTTEEVRAYCLSKKAVIEDMPFDEFTICFKVGGKIFLILPTDEVLLNINVKCDPEIAIELREKYPEVKPGYHMNKKHWNTIIDRGRLSDSFVKQQIDHSYDLVFSSLTKKIKEEINTLNEN